METFPIGKCFTLLQHTHGQSEEEGADQFRQQFSLEGFGFAVELLGADPSEERSRDKRAHNLERRVHHAHAEAWGGFF